MPAALVLAIVLCWPGVASARFELGLDDTTNLTGGDGAKAPNAARAVHATTQRIIVFWSRVAPGGASEPAGFDARNPADTHYDWTAVDAAVRAAHQRGLRVLMTLYGAPKWAQGPDRPSSDTVVGQQIGPAAWDPDPRAFAAFARAAAQRYGGSFPDPLHGRHSLPRVRDWEMWNEEDLPLMFASPHPVDDYRELLNYGYDAVKSVHRTNTVVVGGFAPVSFLQRSISPLRFAADLLCLRRHGRRFSRVRHCPHRARFDVLAHHPYSLAATPTKHAYHYDDVLVGDMGKLNTLLRTADHLHTAFPLRERHRLWVTEWSWPTNPPNHQLGDAPRTAARYVALSMYLMWHSGVQLVVWQNMVDDPKTPGPGFSFVFVGAGLYTQAGRAKPTEAAFRFPLYARVHRGHGYAWGRAPVSARTRVTVQRRTHGHWRSIAHAVTGTDGVFQVHFHASRNASFRALADGHASLAYDSTPVPARRIHATGG